MYKLRIFAAFGIVPGWLGITLLLCGCEQTEHVSTYTVPRHDTLQTPEFLETSRRAHPQPERMIGVVVPQKTSLWFFKLQGNIEAVAARENDVREFLKSIHFSQDDKIEWALPAGWEQLPGAEMRYATLVLNGQPKLEMSVTTLPARPDQTLPEQVVSNFNRWRGQLTLPPIEEEDLERQSEKLVLGDTFGFLLNIIGRPVPKPAGMGQPQQPVQKPAQKEEKAQPQTEPGQPTYVKPADWTEAPPTMFAVVSLLVQKENSKAKVTVTQARGSRIENVNRWRGQLSLPPLTENELNSTAKRVEVGKYSGNLFEMTSGGRSIFGVIVEDHGQTWFVKLDGDAELANRERPQFEAFLKSLILN